MCPGRHPCMITINCVTLNEWQVVSTTPISSWLSHYSHHHWRHSNYLIAYLPYYIRMIAANHCQSMIYEGASIFYFEKLWIYKTGVCFGDDRLIWCEYVSNEPFLNVCSWKMTRMGWRIVMVDYLRAKCLSSLLDLSISIIKPLRRRHITSS